MNEEATRPSETWFAAAVTLVFTLVCSVAVFHHEMWHAELQAWLLARDSNSIAELLQHIRYEGHPALWYLLLYAVTGITHRPEAMQALHLGIAAACVYVFARAAPFPRWVRALFCFGYFPLYEYAVIARNYSLGVFFLFAAAALFPRRREQPWLLGVVLAGAAHTSVHALLVAAALAVTVAVEPFVSRDSRTRVVPAAKTFGLALAGILVAGIWLQPPPDSGFHEAWTTQWIPARAKFVLGFFSEALLPIPGSRGGWGDLWVNTVSRNLAPVLSVAAAALVLPYVARKKLALLMCVTGSVALLAFFYTKYAGNLRHHGFLFIILVLAFWLAESLVAENSSALNHRTHRGRAVGRVALGCSVAFVLAIHAFAAVIAVRREVSMVFSAGRATAALLVERGVDRLPLVGDADYSMPSVLAYLDDRSMYYLRGQRFGTFVVLDQQRRSRITDEQVFAAARAIAQERHSSVGIVLNRRASPIAIRDAVEIGCRSAVLLRAESYCVYRLDLR